MKKICGFFGVVAIFFSRVLRYLNQCITLIDSIRTVLFYFFIIFRSRPCSSTNFLKMISVLVYLTVLREEFRNKFEKYEVFFSISI